MIAVRKYEALKNRGRKILLACVHFTTKDFPDCSILGDANLGLRKCRPQRLMEYGAQSRVYLVVER